MKTKPRLLLITGIAITEVSLVIVMGGNKNRFQQT